MDPRLVCRIHPWIDLTSMSLHVPLPAEEACGHVVGGHKHAIFEPKKTPSIGFRNGEFTTSNCLWLVYQFQTKTALWKIRLSQTTTNLGCSDPSCSAASWYTMLIQKNTAILGGWAYGSPPCLPNPSMDWPYLNISAGLFHCLQKRHASMWLAVIYAPFPRQKNLL